MGMMLLQAKSRSRSRRCCSLWRTHPSFWSQCLQGYLAEVTHSWSWSLSCWNPLDWSWVSHEAWRPGFQYVNLSGNSCIRLLLSFIGVIGHLRCFESDFNDGFQCSIASHRGALWYNKTHFIWHIHALREITFRKQFWQAFITGRYCAILETPGMNCLLH